MKTTIISVAIYLLSAITTVSAQQGVAQTNAPVKQAKTAKPGKMDHSHMPVSVPKNVAPMALSLQLSEDAMSGYNLKLQTQRYVLTPPPAGLGMAQLMGAAIDERSGYLTGHAHLYINGEKIQRVYGSDVHLPASLFKAGINSISLTLNNHGHMYWTIDDKKVVSTLHIDNGAATLLKNQFDSFGVSVAGQP
jgi:hypothetical protein